MSVATTIPAAARLLVKVPLETPEPLDLEPVIAVFHGWIQRDAVEGLLIDVADYRHVPGGPGVVLIGHERDYAVDLGDGVTGMACIEKRGGGEPSLEAQLRAAAARARVAADLLVGAGPLRGWSVREGELVVRVLDRLLAPAGDEGERATAPAVEDAARAIYGPGAVAEAVPAPKGPVGYRLRATPGG